MHSSKRIKEKKLDLDARAKTIDVFGNTANAFEPTSNAQVNVLVEIARIKVSQKRKGSQARNKRKRDPIQSFFICAFRDAAPRHSAPSLQVEVE